jgi:hypothetical protein
MSEELGPKDTARLAVVESQLTNIEKLVIRLENKLDLWQSNLPTRTEMEREIRQVVIYFDKELKHRDKEIAELKSDNQWLWRLVIGAIVVGSIGLIFFVVQLFIKGGVS